MEHAGIYQGGVYAPPGVYLDFNAIARINERAEQIQQRIAGIGFVSSLFGGQRVGQGEQPCLYGNDRARNTWTFNWIQVPSFGFLSRSTTVNHYHYYPDRNEKESSKNSLLVKLLAVAFGTALFAGFVNFANNGQHQIMNYEIDGLENDAQASGLLQDGRYVRIIGSLREQNTAQQRMNRFGCAVSVALVASVIIGVVGAIWSSAFLLNIGATAAFTLMAIGAFACVVDKAALEFQANEAARLCIANNKIG